MIRVLRRLASHNFANQREIDRRKICVRRSGFSVQATKATLEWRIPGGEFDSHAYGALLQGCVQNEDWDAATALHCQIIKRGNCLDLFASNIILNAYVKAEVLDDAIELFDEMTERNTISFVTLIRGYGKSLLFSKALGLFSRLHREGHELNPFVFTSFLKLLVDMERADLGWCVHAGIVKLGHDTNAFVGTALIDAYSVCGCVESAGQVFDGIVRKDMVTWTGIIACYANNNCFADAIRLFSHMRMMGFKPNNYTFAAMLKACIGLEAFSVAKGVHSCVLKSCFELDIYVGTGLLELYVRSRNLAVALRVFEEIPKKDVIPWSFMISRFAQSGQCKEAMDLFCRMRRAFIMPNQFTYASVLQACATAGTLGLGRQIHGLVVKVGLNLNVYVSNALMDVYAKCESMDNALTLFHESTNINDVSWNTIIVGYVHLGDGEKALSFFQRVLRNAVQATEVTYSSALRACASLAALEPGVQIHSLTIKTNYDSNGVVANALIDVYFKCGTIKEARSLFDELKERDVISWNVMISGYSMHGRGPEALETFEMMVARGCQPNAQTFVGLLAACANSGLLREGQACFESMVPDYGIEPCMEHYTCMIWLFGRSGRLDEALKFINEMPFEPSVMAWRALLGACVLQRNLELARTAAEHVLRLEPMDDSAHVLLSNLYARERKWENVAVIRKSMKKKGMKKATGLSWIENQGSVHHFTVSDTSHPDMKLINGMLERLNLKTRRAGYVPDRSAILLDVEDGEKDRLLWVHSERLALAFGLIRTPRTRLIRIIKNLRICVDCHTVMKLTSKVLQRDLVVRDINRFHHFHDGICSCGDYW